MNPCKTAAKRTKATMVFLVSVLSFYILSAFAYAGADYVYMARLEVADSLAAAIDQALENRIDVHRERHIDRHGHHDSRKEVMS